MWKSNSKEDDMVLNRLDMDVSKVIQDIYSECGSLRNMLTILFGIYFYVCMRLIL